MWLGVLIGHSGALYAVGIVGGAQWRWGGRAVGEGEWVAEELRLRWLWRRGEEEHCCAQVDSCLRASWSKVVSRVVVGSRLGIERCVFGSGFGRENKSECSEVTR